MSTRAESDSPGAAELVSGLLSVISIAASILALFWLPMRVSPFAALVALIAAAMAPRDARLPLAAVAIAAICFIGGMTIAAATTNPFY